MPTPTLSLTIDTPALYKLGHVWVNPENPTTIDSTSGMTPVLTVDQSTLPTAVPTPVVVKYRLTNVWTSIDKNYDGINENQNHKMELLVQSSDNGTDWTNQTMNGILAMNNATGRLRFPMNSQRYAQLSARIFPTNDGTHAQATVFMGLDGDFAPNPLAR